MLSEALKKLEKLTERLLEDKPIEDDLKLTEDIGTCKNNHLNKIQKLTEALTGTPIDSKPFVPKARKHKEKKEEVRER